MCNAGAALSAEGRQRKERSKMERFAIVANGLVGLALMITGVIYDVLGMTICGAVAIVIAVSFYFIGGEAEEQES